MFCAFSDISGPKFYALGKSIRVITIKREHGSLKIAESAGNYTDKPVSPALSSPNLVLTSFFCPILIYQSSQCRRGTPAFAVWPFNARAKILSPCPRPQLSSAGFILNWCTAFEATAQLWGWLLINDQAYLPTTTLIEDHYILPIKKFCIFPLTSTFKPSAISFSPANAKIDPLITVSESR